MAFKICAQNLPNNRGGGVRCNIHMSGLDKNMFFLSFFSEMAPKSQTKPDDWEGPQKIRRPPPGCTIEELVAWLADKKAAYHTLNKADRKAYQKVRNSLKNRRDYNLQKDDPGFLIRKSQASSVSNSWMYVE